MKINKKVANKLQVIGKVQILFPSSIACYIFPLLFIQRHVQVDMYTSEDGILYKTCCVSYLIKKHSEELCQKQNYRDGFKKFGFDSFECKPFANAYNSLLNNRWTYEILREHEKNDSSILAINSNTSNSTDAFKLSSEELTQINQFIDRLWQTREKGGKVYMLTEDEMIRICQKVRPVLLSQPILLNLQGPLKICGDIHGQFSDLLHLFELCGKPEKINYLFLGDYVDRGRHSLETISLLLCYKLKFPYRFFLLRGNHESQSITRIYGFFDECKRRFTVKLWRNFIDTFNCFPICAIIESQIFCCHGGLSPDLLTSDVTDLAEMKAKIQAIQRPCDIPECGLLCDLLWSDPWFIDVTSGAPEPSGWEPSERGVSYMFAPNIVDQFLERFNLDLVVRAHQVVEDGYEFYANRSLVTIFSAPNYCGEFDNAAAVFCLSRLTNNLENLQPTYSNLITSESEMHNDEADLEGSFQIIRSIAPKRRPF